MKRDEHEMLIEYSEMTALNLNTKEYEGIKNDYLSSKNTVINFKWLVENFVSKFRLIKA